MMQYSCQHLKIIGSEEMKGVSLVMSLQNPHMHFISCAFTCLAQLCGYTICAQCLAFKVVMASMAFITSICLSLCEPKTIISVA